MPENRDLKKIVIITAPSGSGKSTIVQYLLKHIPQLAFSVSACTRSPRLGEVDGTSYYFMDVDAFKEKIEAKAFAEYEMVYAGKYYGTLNSELERIWNKLQYPLIDIDVQGALRLKKNFKNQALSLFIQAPSIAELERRLRGRGTETEASLQERLAKAQEELLYAHHFDACIVNDDLATACEAIMRKLTEFINN
jgi:guanylate kinase